MQVVQFWRATLGQSSRALKGWVPATRPSYGVGALYGMIGRVSRRGVGSSGLTEAQEAWVRHSEALWREAHTIAAADPELDAGDVYHALRSLEFAPAERLHRGLTRVRHRPHPR